MTDVATLPLNFKRARLLTPAFCRSIENYVDIGNWRFIFLITCSKLVLLAERRLMSKNGEYMAQNNTPASKIQLFFYGCVGAAAPDIIQLYSKRWTMPGVHFNITQYLVVSVVYIALGGILGLVLSRRNAPAALAIGVGTPVVVGILANFAKSTTGVVRGETSEVGSLVDLFVFP